MAKTYYDYQRRDPESQINWAEVGKNFTEMLSDEVRVREEKKAAINKDTREFQKMLNDTPHGANATANQRVIEYGGDIQKAWLMHERALKQGLLSPQDYAKYRQNALDGTDAMFEVARLYNENLAETMERMETNSSAQLEQFLQSEIDQYGNWNKAGIIVNPDTLVVSAAGLNPDGSVNPKDLRAMSALKDQVMQRFDPYDLQGNAAKFADNTGAWSKIERIAGENGMRGVMAIIKDPMIKEIKREDYAKYGLSDAVGDSINLYLEAENDYIDGQLNGVNVGGSLLTDYGDGTYGYARENQLSSSSKERDKQVLARDVAGYQEVELNEEQKKVAKEIYRNAIRNRHTVEISNLQSLQQTRNYSESGSSSNRPSDSTRRAISSYKPWWEVRNASTIEERQTALDAVIKADDNLEAITITDDGNGGFTVFFDYTEASSIPDVQSDIFPNSGGDKSWFRAGQHMYDIVNDDLAKQTVGGWSDANEVFPSFGNDASGNPITQITARRQAPIEVSDYRIQESIFDESDPANQLNKLFSESDQYMGSARFKFTYTDGDLVITDKFENKTTTIADAKEKRGSIRTWLTTRAEVCNTFNDAGVCLSRASGGGSVDEEVEVEVEVDDWGIPIE